MLRVRVAILVDKPLRRFLRVDVLGDGEETIMLIQYERLPNFCFRCGLLGHMLWECPENDKQGPLIDQELTYGNWDMDESRWSSQESYAVELGW
ncbi:hypothetical protein LWI28_014146 [Acer negundo]|uniref:CCHC-type domain-containing protein n=1 Tax=Acer negundo TaxID=4023 RepID=A0AAD5IZ31_ACENE|nr:hypothetical protein LWI28_014146 [Acer negundo]